ncbi:MAG TPA: PilZ domain-containing protein [Candidatus Nitrosotenuis sp.]|jgi:hypothetical protein|nr:PilZ domain-containing protein [Candidatus Nitrosotenuis sp.]
MNWLSMLGRLIGGERRKGWRRKVKIPVQVALLNSVLPCEMIEASPAGFRLRAPRKLPLKQVLYVRFPGKIYSGAYRGTELEVPVQILWNRHWQAGSLAYRCGGRFDPMPQTTREFLAERLLLGGVDLADDVSERRRHARAVRPAHIGDQELVIRDLSEAGAGLISLQEIPVGAVVEVALEVDEQPVLCTGKVLWSRPILEGEAFHVGVEFQSLSARARKHLVAAIAKMIQEQSAI